MYCLIAMVMLIRGFADAIMMRSQQALAFHSGGYLPPDHYNQIFSAHGTIMIFFGGDAVHDRTHEFRRAAAARRLGRRLSDLQFGELMADGFRRAAGLTILRSSIGEFSQAGWIGHPPLSELKFLPGVGVDYYLWALQISGIGTLLTGVSFVTTILKISRPSGMSLRPMPMFCWTALASNLLIVAAFPILTATFAMLLAWIATLGSTFSPPTWAAIP